jgi:hypothetical protein
MLWSRRDGPAVRAVRQGLYGAAIALTLLLVVALSLADLGLDAHSFILEMAATLGLMFCLITFRPALGLVCCAAIAIAACVLSLVVDHPIGVAIDILVINIAGSVAGTAFTRRWIDLARSEDDLRAEAEAADYELRVRAIETEADEAARGILHDSVITALLAIAQGDASRDLIIGDCRAATLAVSRFRSPDAD